MSYLGISYESYAMELSSSDATAVAVIHHGLPYFVPVQQIATHCSTVAKEIACGEFVWTVYRYLHAFVARRQETMLAQVFFCLFVCYCTICCVQEQSENNIRKTRRVAIIIIIIIII